MQVEFPHSFLWGAAISSYQCEGGNFSSDWYIWEKEKGLQQAGRACGHYHLFKEDFESAQKLNLNCLRFSIEWARICPDSSTFLEEELEHYNKIVDSLLKYKLKPLVTLHHFTNPIWFANKGGWSKPENVDYFLAYLKKVVSALKDKVEFWFIFNEPLVYIYNGFIQGVWPPGEKSLKQARRALANIIKAYLIGYQEINRIYRGSSISAQISLTKHIRVFSGCPETNLVLNSLSAFLRSKSFNFWLLDYLRTKNSLDFVGVNYYCKEYSVFKGLLGAECSHETHKERKNHLGWNVYAQGFFDILMRIKKLSLPVIVTENGTAEVQDSLYEDYLVQHLKSLARAISEGVDVRGYLWWSLLDNFEWDKGFKHRFGLIDVDYGHEALTRKIKPFAYTYARICKENRLKI